MSDRHTLSDIREFFGGCDLQRLGIDGSLKQITGVIEANIRFMKRNRQQ